MSDPPREARPRLFFSYSRADRDAAQPIIAVLEDAGFSVWWDGLLEAGTVFTQTTEAALESAVAVVVLWSATSVNSHWVRDEAQIGRDKRRLVPLSIDGSIPPLGFRQFQCIDLSSWDGNPNAEAIRNVKRVIAQFAGREEVAPPAALPPVAAPKPVSRRWLLAASGTAVAAAGGIAVAWRNGAFGGAADDRSPSLAILPFANLSDDASQAYFADGLSQELRSALSGDRDIEVVAQTSSSAASKDRGDPKKIAASLGVTYLLDGSVRREGNRVRVSAQLIDGSTGFDRWSETYQHAVADIFTVQTEIAQKVTKALTAAIPGANGRTATRIGSTASAVALDAYLRGVALYDLAADEMSDRAALAQFDAAVATDPSYAAAWAARARAQTTIANNYGKTGELLPLYDEAIASARKAVTLAPRLADGQAALGYVLFNGRLDAKAAAEPYALALRDGSGSADILQSYATYAARTGQFDEARRAIARAAKLDPLNATTFRTMGMVEFAADDYPAARVAFVQALKLNPEIAAAHGVLGLIAYLSGDTKNAAVHFARERSQLYQLAGWAIVRRRTGDLAGAQTALASLRTDYGDNALYQEAQILAQWGDIEGAIARLEKARIVGDSGLVLARNDPLLTPLRKDSRFAALLASMGFS